MTGRDVGVPATAEQPTDEQRCATSRNVRQYGRLTRNLKRWLLVPCSVGSDSKSTTNDVKSKIIRLYATLSVDAAQFDQSFRTIRLSVCHTQRTVSWWKQEAQLSLTNRPKFVHADILCCAVKSCPLTPSMRGIPSSYLVHVWYEKTRMAGLQSGEGRMIIDSVVWAQEAYINVTDTQTDSDVAIANAAPTHCVRRQKLCTITSYSLPWSCIS